MTDEPVPVSVGALPDFLSTHADEVPDPDAVRGVLWAYDDTLKEWRAHPFHGGPPRRDEPPTLDGPPTFQRISGRLDGLFLAMQWLALPLADLPDYNPMWRPAVLGD